MFEPKKYYRSLKGGKFDFYVLSAEKKKAVVGKKFRIFPIKKMVWVINAILIDPESTWSAGQLTFFLPLELESLFKDITDQYMLLFDTLLSKSEYQPPDDKKGWH